jgi:hypothetical protein
MSAILFPLGMRLTTWFGVAAFVTLAVRRRDWQPVVAAWVWLLSFEAAFDISREAMGYGHFQSRMLFIVGGAVTVVWFGIHGLRPAWPWTAATVLIWIVWLVAGFPANQHSMVGFDSAAEVFNEMAKTAWGLAYLLPLYHRPRVGSRSDPLPHVQAVAAGDAAGAELEVPASEIRAAVPG